MFENYDIVNVFEKYIDKDCNIENLYIDISENCKIKSFLDDMEHTMQNEMYHAEGNVLIHTKLVVKKLIQNPDFYKFSKHERIELLIAAVFHDVGKIKTTKFEDGRFTSPHHAQKGADMMRKFLWRFCNMAGTKEKQATRENICNLIRYHMLPYYLVENKDTYSRMLEISMIGELVKGFTIEKLCILAQADGEGRIAKDNKKSSEQIQLCMMLAQDENCLDKPFKFIDMTTRRAFFKGRDVYAKQTLYDDTWGTVYITSALPGTGKDTWIKEHLSEYPMISLDDIREELKIKPTQSQGAVVQCARERAKEYLRKKQSFVWNSTNITKDMRKKIIKLFENYGANVTVIYLETDWKTELERNNNRKEEHIVPIDVLQRMQSQLQLPTIDEARNVKWYCL